MLLGLYAVKAVNIPLLLVFRRVALLFTVTSNFMIRGESPSKTVLITLSFLITGAVLAGYEKLNDDYFGYMLIFATNFVQSFTIILSQKFNEDKSLKPFDINLFFAMLGMPIMMGVTQYTGDNQELINILILGKYKDLTHIVSLILSGTLGLILQISGLVTIATCGGITMNIAGVSKDGALTLAGFIFFSDANTSIPSMIGITISFLGAIYYMVNNVMNYFAD